MWILIFRELGAGFRRLWKLYLTNTLSILFILVLFAYIDGSRRQLSLQNSAFHGDAVVKLQVDVPNAAKILKKKVPGLLTVTEKIRSSVTYRKLHTMATGNAELVGVDLTNEPELRHYITFR